MMNTYRPYNVDLSHWSQIATFVRDSVIRTYPQKKQEAAALLGVTRGYATWLMDEVGLELGPAAFKPGLVERYASLTFPNTAHGRRLQQRLVLVASAALGSRPSRATRVGPPPSAQPYTEEESAALDSWAKGLRQEWRRRDASVVMALGRGAGLEAHEMFALKLTDMYVDDDDDAMFLSVEGRKNRIVPVFAEQASLLLQTLTESPVTDYFLSAHTRRATDVASAFPDERGIGRPSSIRLRSTWIVRHLNAGSPLREFLEAAGLTSTATLNRYLPYVARNLNAGRILAGMEVGR